MEETLRYDAPVQFALRTATEDTELCGAKIPAGSVVAPLMASANRDSAVFEDPDRFDVSRRPRGHLAFGHGVHFCLGAALARLEARVAFETLLEIAHAPSLVDDDVAWIDPLTLRGPKHLRVLC